MDERNRPQQLAKTSDHASKSEIALWRRGSALTATINDVHDFVFLLTLAIELNQEKEATGLSSKTLF